MQHYTLLIIGGSAGSLEVVLRILSQLPTGFPLAVVVVMHRKSFSDSTLTDIIAYRSTLPVKEAEDKEPILPGTIYLSPADYHLLIEKDRTFSLDYSEKIHYSRPSIDATFETAAEIYGKELVCVLLSGANADGAHGLETAKHYKSLIIVQDPEAAEVAYMPLQAIRNVAIDHILANDQLEEFIRELS